MILIYRIRRLVSRPTYELNMSEWLPLDEYADLPPLGAHYDHGGIRFRYPNDWTLTEQHHGDESVITVQSPETAFWSISIFRDRPFAEHVMESALDAFRDEYAEFDVYPSSQTIRGHDAVARDIEFVCLELLNSAFLRAFETDRATVLILYQANDSELESLRTVMEHISASLKLD